MLNQPSKPVLPGSSCFNLADSTTGEASAATEGEDELTKVKLGAILVSL